MSSVPITLPSNAGDSGLKDEPKKLPKEETRNLSVRERITSGVDAVRNAFTGADIPIEFPELEEVTDIRDDSIDFFEAVLNTAKSSPIIFARDDKGKAEILSNLFADDERFEGPFEDAFGLPLIKWNDVYYYINKPGLSTTDFNTFVGEMLKFSPASRYVSGAKDLLGIGLRGVGAYGLTETSSEVGERMFTPKTTEQKTETVADVAKDIGVVTGIGVAADVLVPPVARAATAGLRATGKLGGERGQRITQAFPKLSPEAVQESKYPLTLGQRLTPPPRGITPQETEQITLEDQLRRTTADPGGTEIIRRFDEDQLQLIMADAMSLFEEFDGQLPGFEENFKFVPLTAAERAAALVSGRAAALKEQSGVAYEAVKAADPQPFMSRQGVEQTIENILNVLSEEDFALSQLTDFPALESAVTNLRRVRKLARNPQFKDQSLNVLHGYQKRLGRSIGSAQNAEERRLLSLMKARLDETLYDGIEQGIITGDQEVLDQLKSATELYRDYMTLRGKSGGKNLNKADNAANALLEMLSAGNYTGKKVADFLFGHHPFNPNQAVPIMLDKLKDVLPADEYAAFVGNVKNGILAKALTNREGFVSRNAIVNNFDNVFVQQRAIINKLFTPEELKNLREFRNDVLPTLWAETVGNPSKSAYAMFSGLRLRNLLPRVPLLGRFTAEIERGMARQESKAQGKEAVRQSVISLQLPALSQSAQSALRIYLDDQTEESVGIEIPEETRQMLDEQLEDIKSQPPMVDEDIVEEPLAMQDFTPASPMQMPVFEPLPQTSGPMTVSPTPPFPSLLPSEEDREIAMRRRQGIAGLVA